MGQSGQSAGWLFHAGQQVDHFRVMRPLGRGGMADVYLARDTKLGRKVALKVIQADALGSKDAVERFLFEARATARFNHPHIVTVYFVGEHDGQPYLALEYLEGQTLRQRLDQERPGVQETLRVALAVADALQAAHAEQIIHRDLKPDNVWLARDGRLRVLDFGLARVVAGDAPTGDSAPSGEAAALPHREQASTLEAGFLSRGTGLRGTPAYMAPEQWQEQPTTGATDVWALGVMLHELLCGRRPYRERTVFKLGLQICSDAAAPALSGDDLPEALPALVARCLRKAPAERPPAAEVADQLRQLLSRDQRLSPDASPFRGLLPFDERHSALFFGRDAEVATFVERLRTEPVLPVVGPSGAGKSSFVRAGVIPRLRERGPLELIELRPGATPFAALADRLAAAELPSSRQSSPFGAALTPRDGERPREKSTTGAQQDLQQLAHQLRAAPRQLNLLLQRLAERRGSSVLLFVDQLEELDTLVADEAEQIAFMQAICTAADDPLSPVRVVLTLREEFISRLAAGPGAQEALSQITVLRSPSPEALEQTLLRPVEAAGYRYDDPELVPQMVAEVRGEASCLPLLQFAGQLLWERRDVAGRLLRRSVHEEMGGVAGALARHADGVLAGLSSGEVQLSRAILLRMTTSEGARRVLARSAVLDGLDPAAERVLGRLIDARLLTVWQAEQEGDALLELVHESLVLNWGRLRRWIEESREELVLLEEIGQAAALWDRRGRPDQEVWHGEALTNAQRAMEHCTTEVPGQVREFLAAGRARQLRQQRRRRIGLGAALTALALIAAVSVVVALSFSQQKRRAEQGQAEAELQRAEAQREAARAALGRGEPLEARARLRMALEASDDTHGRALWAKVQREPRLWGRTVSCGMQYFDICSDGKLVGGGTGCGEVVLLDAATGTVLRQWKAHPMRISTAKFSPDGKLLATGGDDRSIRIWDTKTGKLAVTLNGHTHRVVRVKFSPDGRTLVSGAHDSTVRLWDVASGRLLKTLTGHRGATAGIDLSPDGKTIASGSLDQTVRLWDAASGRHLRTLIGHRGNIWAVAFGPDGRRLASAGEDHTVRIWDARTGALARELSGPDTTLSDLAFAPDGKTLAAACYDKTIRVWDVASGRSSRILRGHRGAVWAVCFNPNGEGLASASMSDSTVQYWSLRRTSAGWNAPGHGHAAYSMAFAPDGKTLATAGFDDTIRLWDVASGEVRQVLRGHGGHVQRVVFAPDGRTLASASFDGTVRLWEAATGALLGVLKGHQSHTTAVAFSPDGKTLVSASTDNTVRLWDVRTRAQTRVLRGHTNQVIDATFSPDGRAVASAGEETTVRIWDLHTGTARVLRGHTAGVHVVAFSPDGRALVSGSTDGSVRLWDPRSGAGRILWQDSQHPIFFLAFHPSGQQIATVTETGQSRLIALPTGEQRLRKGSHFGGVAFSPDGRLLATGAGEHVQILETSSERPHWRGFLVRGDPPLLLSHHGWIALGLAPRPGRPPAARWPEILEQRGLLFSSDAGSGLACLYTSDDNLELWDTRADRRLDSWRAPPLQGVEAFAGGCVVVPVSGKTWPSTELWLHRRGGKAKRLSEQALGYSVDRDEILVSTAREVAIFSVDGSRRATFPPPRPGLQVLAMLRWKGLLLLGDLEGNIRSIPLAASSKGRMVSFDNTVRAPVFLMRTGPRDTLVLGLSNGTVQVWDPIAGVLLDEARLHGSAPELFLDGHLLYATTTAGAYLVWDLSALSLERCALLREVWTKVPVVWEQGKAVLRPPPPDHPCAPSPP